MESENEEVGRRRFVRRDVMLAAERLMEKIMTKLAKEKKRKK